MVSTNPLIGVASTLSRMRNTFCGVPKAEIERRNNALLQAMTVSSIVGYLERINYVESTQNSLRSVPETIRVLRPLNLIQV